MNRMIRSLLLSLFLIVGTESIYASGSNVSEYAQRIEQRDYNRNKDKKHKDVKKENGKGHSSTNHKEDRNHRNTYRDDRNRDVHKPQGRPLPPSDYRHPVPRPQYNHDRYDRHDHNHNKYGYHVNLEKMIRKSTKGGKDVQVWQVAPDTYLVRYRKGRKIYTRYLYPYSNVYGRPNIISVNWHPMSQWIPIPSIHLNINF